MSHISKELISKAAEFFRVVGDETRMKILCTIAGGELCVNDIAAEVEMNAASEMPLPLNCSHSIARKSSASDFDS